MLRASRGEEGSEARAPPAVRVERRHEYVGEAIAGGTARSGMKRPERSPARAGIEWR
jgi:hypothetical protein